MIVRSRFGTTSFARAGAVVLVAVAFSACRASDRKGADTEAVAVAPSVATTPAPVIGPQFTLADFARVRWIAGDWRGRMPDGKPFYESYRVVDDSSIRMGGYSDSTFTMQKDSAAIGRRGGVVVHQGSGLPWVATRLDANTVNFASVGDSTNHFTWTRVSPDRWTARLFSGGKEQVVYRMERVKRK